jgi:hypothetical protein
MVICSKHRYYMATEGQETDGCPICNIEVRLEKLEPKPEPVKESGLEKILKDITRDDRIYCKWINYDEPVKQIREHIKKEIKNNLQYICTVAESEWIDVIKKQVEGIIDRS